MSKTRKYVCQQMKSKHLHAKNANIQFRSVLVTFMCLYANILNYEPKIPYPLCISLHFNEILCMNWARPKL